ncbi:hypothetical protein, partial [Streptomyces sp. NPDC005385]|uniref:hypothetical protein n=1 Tax=Streptomyces sp. NPDC005385 TaxID=3157039 RepID=UPI0033A638DF
LLHTTKTVHPHGPKVGPPQTVPPGPEHPVENNKTNGGKMHVSLDRILDAIAAREDDIDDEGGAED